MPHFHRSWVILSFILAASFPSLSRSAEYLPQERLRKLSLHLRGIEPSRSELDSLSKLPESELEKHFESKAESWVKGIEFKDRAKDYIYDILRFKVEKESAYSDEQNQLIGYLKDNDVAALANFKDSNQYEVEGSNVEFEFILKEMLNRGLSWKDVLSNPVFVLRYQANRMAPDVVDNISRIERRLEGVMARFGSMSEIQAAKILTGIESPPMDFAGNNLKEIWIKAEEILSKKMGRTPIPYTGSQESFVNLLGEAIDADLSKKEYNALTELRMSRMMSHISGVENRLISTQISQALIDLDKEGYIDGKEAIRRFTQSRAYFFWPRIKGVFSERLRKISISTRRTIWIYRHHTNDR